jgi:hypothetical protein
MTGLKSSCRVGSAHHWWGGHSCLPFYVFLLFFLSLALADPPVTPIYSQNFEKLKEGPPPDEILILNGTFTVKKIAGNTLLEMSPDPLDTNGILVGPADKNTATVRARIQTTATGKRSNEFGIGACGPGQYKLWLMPAANQLQLIKNDEVKATTPYQWTSGAWTHFKLKVSKTADGKFKIEGSAWPEGKPEPKDWLLNFEDPESPPPGRACLFCTPYATTPARFDDIVLEP